MSQVRKNPPTPIYRRHMIFDVLKSEKLSLADCSIFKIFQNIWRLASVFSKSNFFVSNVARQFLFLQNEQFMRAQSLRHAVGHAYLNYNYRSFCPLLHSNPGLKVSTRLNSHYRLPTRFRMTTNASMDDVVPVRDFPANLQWRHQEEVIPAHPARMGER